MADDRPMDDGDAEPDAGSNGSGAPPQTSDANQVHEDLTREYASEAIRVQWYASRCIHSAACVMFLPQVFDPRRRPWIGLSATADADAIAKAVIACPTGALHFARRDGESETVPEKIRIVAVRNGSYFVSGPVEVTDMGGNVLRRDSRVALCRCGRSQHMPFCDNTHRATGFRTEPNTADPAEVQAHTS